MSSLIFCDKDLRSAYAKSERKISTQRVRAGKKLSRSGSTRSSLLHTQVKQTYTQSSSICNSREKQIPKHVDPTAHSLGSQPPTLVHISTARKVPPAGRLHSYQRANTQLQAVTCMSLKSGTNRLQHSLPSMPRSHDIFPHIPRAN
jgi:hypothetical protein